MLEFEHWSSDGGLGPFAPVRFSPSLLYQVPHLLRRPSTHPMRPVIQWRYHSQEASETPTVKSFVGVQPKSKSTTSQLSQKPAHSEGNVTLNSGHRQYISQDIVLQGDCRRRASTQGCAKPTGFAGLLHLLNPMPPPQLPDPSLAQAMPALSDTASPISSTEPSEPPSTPSESAPVSPAISQRSEPARPMPNRTTLTITPTNTERTENYNELFVLDTSLLPGPQPQPQPPARPQPQPAPPARAVPASSLSRLKFTRITRRSPSYDISSADFAAPLVRKAPSAPGQVESSRATMPRLSPSATTRPRLPPSFRCPVRSFLNSLKPPLGLEVPHFYRAGIKTQEDLDKLCVSTEERTRIGKVLVEDGLGYFYWNLVEDGLKKRGDNLPQQAGTLADV